MSKYSRGSTVPFHTTEERGAESSSKFADLDAAAGPLEKCELIAARISSALGDQQKGATSQSSMQVGF